MLVVGLCGGIGSGKSTVAAMLADLGAVVVDVDDLGRTVLSQPPVREAVAAEFGPAVLAADGSVDRAALAAVVFADGGRLAALEAISHPAINRELEALLAELAAGEPPPPVVVLDMAVLVESDLGRLPGGSGYSRVVVVEAGRAVRLERLALRGLDRDNAEARMARQATDAQRRVVADHVVANDGDLEELASRVADLWADLTRNPA